MNEVNREDLVRQPFFPNRSRSLSRPSLAESKSTDQAPNVYFVGSGGRTTVDGFASVKSQTSRVAGVPLADACGLSRAWATRFPVAPASCRALAGPSEAPCSRRLPFYEWYRSTVKPGLSA